MRGFESCRSFLIGATERAQDISDEQADLRIIELLREEQRSRGGFPRVHAAPDNPTDIDDRRSAALIILPSAASHDASTETKSRGAIAASETMERRGSRQRRFRNALTFVAADASNVGAARESATHPHQGNPRLVCVLRLPARLRDEATPDGAIQRLVADLAAPYAFASGFDEEKVIYAGVNQNSISVLQNINEGLLVELTRTKGSTLRLTFEIDGSTTGDGYPEDVVETVKANARDLKLDDGIYGFEQD